VAGINLATNGKVYMFKQKFSMITGAVALAALALTNPMARAADGPSDPQIVGIVLAADRIDIDSGQIALAESKSKTVREFAQRMVTDHSAVQQSVIGLAAKLGVTAADSPTSDGLKSGARDITAKLNSLKGKEFDKADWISHLSEGGEVLPAQHRVEVHPGHVGLCRAGDVASGTLLFRG